MRPSSFGSSSANHSLDRELRSGYVLTGDQEVVVSTQTIHAPSGFYGQQQHYFNANYQPLQPLPNMLPANNSGFLNQVPQHDFFGHNNIGCAPYSYYGGMTGAYGPPMLPPQSLDVPTRVPLAHETGLEPVFVNAKQYHAILRRRKSRVKAKNAKKLIKGRKRYVHESRHLHAVNRARGVGGHFIKSEEDDSLKTTTSYSSTRVLPELMSRLENTERTQVHAFMEK
ncbi:nuclear transcription factor Y subunit A-9-like [Bidens hawaiensis]|uniref:nuclear transcription factor Y subunit A-9-like n=1 Tax=Bidens hawaiensis TaxID=980011 RepID=UPI004049515C